MADEKNTAENEAPKKAAAPRRRTAKTTIKKEPVERSQTDHKEEKRMTQEALGMVETRGLTASIEAADRQAGCDGIL